MRARTLGLAALAILLLGTAALAVLWALDRAAAPARPEASEATPAPPASGSPPFPASPAPAASGLPEVTPPRIGVFPSAASTVEWERVPIAGKPSELGRELARPAFDALAAARAQMEGCFEAENRRAERAPPGGEDHAGPAVLLLRLESRQGGLDVVGTEIDERGDSSPDLVACARTVLEGWPVPAPAAASGRRYRLKWVVR